MRGSIFNGLPATGPLLERPTMISQVAEKSANPDKAAPAAAAPPVGFGFVAPRPVVRITIPGENYSDETSSTYSAGASVSSPAAPASAPTPSGPSSYVDDAGESYSEESAVNLKRTSAYYDDEPETQTAAVHISPASSSAFGAPKSVFASFSAPVAYSNANAPSTASSGGYSDEDSSATAPHPSSSSSASVGYTDDDDSSAAYPSSSDAATASYTDDTRSQTSKTSVTVTTGYSDDASGGGTPAASYGYTDDSTSSQPSRTSVAVSTGYSDDSSSTAAASYSDQSDSYATATDGYSDDHSVTVMRATPSTDPFRKLATAKATSSTTAAMYSSSATVGYSNDDVSSSTGYNDDNGAGASVGGYSNDDSSASGYSNEGAVAGYSNDAAGAGYTDGTSVAKPKDPFARMQASNQAAYSGSGTAGYSDTSAAASGYAVGYSQADVTPGYSNAEEGATGYSDASASAPNAITRMAPSSSVSSAVGQKPPSDGSRDWNTEFQERMAHFRLVLKTADASATDVLLCCRDLYSLSADFIETAQEIGRTIIEEVSIPSSAKTIKPVNVGGVAGGEKYVQRGIFFKFAIDAFGVYGGDEYAQKAAGHELAGLKAYYNCQIEGLNTPFMLLMDYRGYRLIATTKLPIGGTSLIYGSADGGITIHKEDPTMNAMMEQAAKLINIKPHVVGMRNQTDVLFAPTDIEGHIGSDGRYYVLDTARICPPEPIHKSFTAVILPPEGPMPQSLATYRLWSNRNQIKDKELTGEFWNPWPPLREVGLTTERWMDQIYAHLGVTNPGTNIVSSEEFGEGLLYHLKLDVVTPALSASSQRNRDVNVRASNLAKKIIYGPAILVLRGRKGAQLFNLLRYETVKRSPVPLSSDAFTPFGKHSRDTHNEEVESCFYDILSETIPNFLRTGRLFPHAAGALQAIQRAGINTRMIGFLRSNIVDSQPNATLLRAWILNEMIVRVTKNYLRSKLRRATSKLKPIEPIIIKRFNLLLGASPTTTAFWATEMKAQIVNKFGRNGQALTPTELRVDIDLRSSLNKLALFQLLQSTIGVVFTEDANGRFQVDPSRFEVPDPLSEKDLAKLVVTRKSLLQPELDNLILTNATKASNGDTEKLLELSGAYLPGAEAHPALALQRLHIAEKLLMEISFEMGQRFEQNTLYTSNVTPILHISESSPDFLKQSVLSVLSPKADKHATFITDELIAFLQSSSKYSEILSHLEILRIWVESTPYCPLEISCKLFYLRGCLSIVHRLWSAAEAFLRTSYDCISKVTNVPGAAAAQTQQNGYVSMDNDRPFSLMLLDKLVIVMNALGRPGEALGYAEKFVQQLSTSAFPGRLGDLKRLFGPAPPIALGVYRTYPHERSHIKGVLDPLEKLLTSSNPVDPKELDAWCARVNLTNFDELSGFFLSPGVLQQYLDSGVFTKSPAFPKKMREHGFWHPGTRDTSNSLDVVIMMPPVLTAGNTFDIQISYNVNPNRLEYSKDPHTLLLLKNTEYKDLLKRPRHKYVVPKENIVASFTFDKLRSNPRGTLILRQLTLQEGSYLAVITEGNGDLLGGMLQYWATQPLSIVPASSTSNLVIGHDRFSGYWGHIRDLPSASIVDFSIADSEYNSFDGKNSAATLIAIDDQGKCWKSTRHNYMSEPNALLRERSEETDASDAPWTLMSELFAWKVKSVSVSWTHALILTDNAEVLSVGSNEHGALGHGDTVAQQDPRLVRRIKGKPISSVFAGENRSIALDEFGGVYHWGKSFTTLPELHPFFSGKSKASKGEKIAISKVVFQAFRPISSNAYNYPNEFFKNGAIGYISTEGHAYLWCGSTKLFPVSEEFKPERVTTPSDPIIDLAIGGDAVAYLTVRGEVWTGGTNTGGELGIGVGGVSHLMPKTAFKGEVPYACAAKVVGLESHFITRIEASMSSFYALSDGAEFFSWGGSVSWSPTIPSALKGMKVRTFSTGLKGMLATVDQSLTLPLPHHPLAVTFAEQLEMQKVAHIGGAGQGFGAGGAGGLGAGELMTPKSEEIIGTEFKVEYHEVDPAPDFTLTVTIPKTQLSNKYHLRVVKPGETAVASTSQWQELPLAMKDVFQLEVDGSYSKGQWGSPPHYVARNPPMAPGPFQLLILKKGDDGAETIKYRSPVFTLRKSAFEYKLTISPELPKPRQKATFTVFPAPSTNLNQWIVIREKNSGTMYGCVQVKSSENTWEPFTTGTFVASWEHTSNMQAKPMQTYAVIEFECGEALADRPQLELEVIPSGPYYKGQSVVLDWKYTKNPPASGTQFFGALYLASQKALTAVMQGGYTALTEASGTTTLTLPSQKEEYEFRAWQVTSSGMVKIKGFVFPVTLDSAPAEPSSASSAPQPSSTSTSATTTTAATSSTSSAPVKVGSTATIEVQSAHVSSSPSSAQTASTSSASSAATSVSDASSSNSSSSSSSSSTLSISIPDWESFFTSCGFDKGTVLAYSKLAQSSGISVSKVHLFDGGILANMKITNLSHQLMILERIHALKQAQLEAWLQKFIQHAASLSPSLD